MRNRLKDLLVYSKPISEQNWSHTPGADPAINIDRLIAQLPPFRVTSDAEQKILKTLIVIPQKQEFWEGFWNGYQSLDNFACYLKAGVENKLSALQNEGHPVYILLNNKLIPFDAGMFAVSMCQAFDPDHKSTEASPLSLVEIERLAAEQFSIPLSSLLMVDQRIMREFIKGDENEWESLSSYEQIDLSNSNISMDSFNQLLRLHASKIHALNISNCSNLLGHLDESIELPNLKILIANSPSHKTALPIAELIKASHSLEDLQTKDLRIIEAMENNFNLFSEKLKNLKHLKLHHFEHVRHAIQFLKINPQYISVYSLWRRDEYADILQFLLNTPAIIREIDYLDWQFLPKCDGAWIQKLQIRNTKIRIKQLSITSDNVEESQAFLNRCEFDDLEIILIQGKTKTNFFETHFPSVKPKKLKEAMLYDAGGSPLSLFSPGSVFDSLKKLVISTQVVSSNLFSKLSEHCPGLNELTLAALELDGAMFELQHFSSLKFLSLLRLDVNKFLVPLLRSATNIKSLGISDCSFSCLNHLQELYNSGFRLTSLNEINLSKCNIDKEYVELLIALAPNLLVLNLVDSASSKSDLHNFSIGNTKKHQVITSGPNQESIKLYLKDLARSTATIIDADTKKDKKVYEVDRIFIGNPTSPDVRMVREKIYDVIRLNPHSMGKADPFILERSTSDLMLEPVLNLRRSTHPLYETFKNAGKNHYYSRRNLTLTTDWFELPSVSASDDFREFYIEQKAEVEIKFSRLLRQYVIRLKDGQQTVTLEQLIYSQPPRIKEFDLPAGICEIIKFCRGFRDLEIKNLPSTASAQDNLNELIKKRTGSCRHRVVVFYHLMKEKYPDIQIGIDQSKPHLFVEINYNGEWLSCDLGGYDSDITIQNNGLRPLNERIECTSYESFSLTLGERGTPLPFDFFQRAKNLTTVTLKQRNKLPLFYDFKLIDTLKITASSFTANELFNLLLSAPNIKTLILDTCNMLPSEFIKLDFSRLKKLENLQMRGRFITDDASLAVVLKTVGDNVEVITESENLLKIEATETNELKISPISKVPSRYFKPLEKNATQSISEIKQKLFNETNGPVLVDTSNIEGLRQELMRYSQTIHRPSFYIHHADELRCGAPFIHRMGNIGKICPGPGGPLYYFLNSKYKLASLIINYECFTAAQIASFNAVIDEIPSADGTLIPPGYQIIGLIDKSNPNAYQGGDFYSRFAEQLKAPKLSPPTPKAVFKNSHSKMIELCGGDDWESRLLGYWIIENNALRFQEGALLTAIKSHSTICLNNAPNNNADFNRFIHDLKLHGGVYHCGELLASLPDNFQLNFTHEVALTDKHNYLSINTSNNLPDSAILLNQATLPDFLGTYVCDKDNNLIFKEGLITTRQDSTIQVCLGMTLNINTWLKIIEACRLHQVKLHLSIPQGVTVPKEFGAHNPPKNKVQFPIINSAMVVVTQDPEKWLAARPMVIEIDIDELEPHHLFPSIYSEYDAANNKFICHNKTGFVLPELAKGGMVVLTGKGSTEMQAAIQKFLFERTRSKQHEGVFCVLTQNEHEYSFMSPVMDNAPAPQKKYPETATVTYENRLPAVIQAIEEHPFVILSGASGIGKTHFMLHDLSKHYQYYFGENQLEAALNDKRPGIKLLCIDEANLTNSQRTMFKGLCRNTKNIFYNGKYYKNVNIRIIFAMNPATYGGERQMPELFSHHHGVILEFGPLPGNVIYDLVIRPCLANHLLASEIAPPILDVIDFMTACSTDHMLITSREIEMMVLATLQKTESLIEWAKYYAYKLARPYVPLGNSYEFEQQFKTMRPQVSTIQLPDFVITSSNQIILDSLLDHLTIREAKKKGQVASTHGLGGVILEGNPGVGKSVLVKKLFLALGLKENVDFFIVPVTMRTEEKINLLLKIFHEGKIVIIDEINTAPMIESVLNAILSGRDLNGKPADKKGFLLIGTQNPTSFHGRIATTLPLQHRVETLIVSDYTYTEMRLILESLLVPRVIAKTMVDEYLQAKHSNPHLCFRDLQKCAKNWTIENLNKPILSLPLNTFVPQVGQICKTITIANVEIYFANTIGFSALPLWKERIQPYSIRQIVKTDGSIQGEILSIAQCKKTLDKMGYDSEIVSTNADITQLIHIITTSLAQGNLAIIGIAVDRDTGHPDPAPINPEKVEHAAVIKGFNYQTDEVTLIHWGREYSVTISALFLSNKALVETRKPEAYIKNPDYNVAQRQTIAKYIEVDTEHPSAKITASPAINSGFKNRLLVVKKPDLRNLLHTRTQSFLLLSRQGLFANSPCISVQQTTLKRKPDGR